jgi:hypothetical protein
VHSAVVGIASSCTSDPDSILVDLLGRTIANTRTWLAAPAPVGVDETQWLEVCELTARV